MVGVEHERSSLGLAASNRSQSFVLFRQGNLDVNLLQILFRHRLYLSNETLPKLARDGFNWLEAQ